MLYQNPLPYFAKHLMNKGKLKHVCEFQEKFLKVLHFLRNFLRLKESFKMAGGSSKFMILHGDDIKFGKN